MPDSRICFLHGRQVKVCSSNGEPLGTLIVPEDSASRLYNSGVAEYTWIEDIENASVYNGLQLLSCAGLLHRFILCHSIRRAGFVEVRGIDLEDIDRVQGFAFLPGTGYFRGKSKEADGKDEKPVESGPYLRAAREVAG